MNGDSGEAVGASARGLHPVGMLARVQADKPTQDDEPSSLRAKRVAIFAEVSPELHRRTRIRAIEEGRTLAQLVADAMTRYLDDQPPAGMPA